MALPGEKKFRSIQSKFLAINLPLIMLSVALLMGAFEYYVHHTALQGLNHKLDRILAGHSEVLTPSLWYMDGERLDLIAQAIRADENVIGVSIKAANNEILVEIGSFKNTRHPHLTKSKNIIYKDKGRSEHIGTLTVALTDELIHEESRQRLLITIGMTVLLLISTILSALLANKWVIDIPLQRLLSAISTTEKANIRERVEWQSNDELGTIVRAFNKMQESQDGYERKLTKARNELEERVIERTSELQESEKQLSEAQRIAKIGNWHWDFKTGKVHGSDQIFEIFDLDPDTFSGEAEDLLSKFHPDDPPLLSIVEKAELAGETSFSLEHRIRDNSGPNRFVLEIGEVTYNSSGKAISLTSTVQDITERKKIDQMKNEFISTVNHELRTPLTSIHGSLGLLNNNVVGELPEKAKPMLGIAYRNTERLISLINDLLDIEKIATGKMVFNLEKSNISELMVKAIEANQGFAETHNTKITITQKLDNAFVKVDPKRIDQIFANLISNAAKFTPQGKEVEISLTQENDYYRISVTDYGPGVPDEFKEQIFSRFTQADSTDTRAKDGTGLGLAICKELVTRMGGDIDYKNREEGGATFWFDLPIYQTS